MFIKSFAAVAAATAMGAGSAFAGPYVNIENNAGFVGSDYSGATTEFHVGYEGDLGESAGYYVQAGPSLVSVDGEDTTTELSGKVGVTAELTERVSAYGEVAFTTIDGSDDNGYGTKVGLTYRF